MAKKKGLNKRLMVGAIVLILPILLVGCVSKSEYEALESGYNTLQEEYTTLRADYASLLEDKISIVEEAENLQGQLEELQYSLRLYEETGIKVYNIDKLPKIAKYGYGSVSVISFEDPPDEDCVTLFNYPYTENPSFEELMQFLSEDDTDLNSYASYMVRGKICGWFAESIHNKAEKVGITSAFVIIDFVDELEGHALNAFNTTDKGLVFIDCTGEESNAFVTPIPWSATYVTTYIIGDIDNNDAIAYVKVNKPYGLINIGMSYGLEYSEYKRWQSDVENMRQRFDLTDTHLGLSQIVKESDTNLGSFFESGGIVESITIYW